MNVVYILGKGLPYAWLFLKQGPKGNVESLFGLQRLG